MTDTLILELKVNEVLSILRPYLKLDDGDIEFVRFDKVSSIAEVRFLGRCKTCPMSIMTLRAGVEKFILKHIPEVRRVEMVK
jgi:Fe-S cluster biogenesis protein NfuA